MDTIIAFVAECGFDDYPVQIGRCGNCFEPIYYGDAYWLVSVMTEGKVDESMCCSIGCVPEEYTARQVSPEEVAP